ncbi:ATP-dependent DNA helicase Rep [Sporomusa silvacetica DSM 10669]|uniref:ATP-dependent DNA helicase Rep n=1 Tax=Sporomusa silvacetica DSM 10669 TaxID=1123289 RepID=A0ABZ3INN7_9FIRM|nr:UvrD-helicase domain-containing protein [Sporomusa silvacetica]OZC21985.1 ATP-dependent DNA helicase Rep [Sporomusa silvacetica DSM 10669]
MAQRRFADEIDEILYHIKNGNNFLLSGGAGSGKTYSLVQTLKKISLIYPTVHIACVTYTNAAAIEIQNRAEIKNLKVSTIHDFLWDTIAPFQKEMKQTLIELVNDSSSSIKNPNEGQQFVCEFENGIKYKEYVRLDRGEISHDEVIVLAQAMYKKYVKLCDILKDKFHFIFVDEYQDTSPLVIEILLSLLPISSRKNIIGFFGDSMQAIYESGIGDVDSYIKNGYIQKVEKKQNRRNPSSVIHLANKLRTDGLQQEPSDDNTAPNMINGVVKQGSIKFLYSESFDLNFVKSSSWCKNWDFTDSKKTKELRLTHNLIADEAGFSELMAIYDADPIFKFKRDLKKEIKRQGKEPNPDDTFDHVVTTLDWYYSNGENRGRHHKDVLLDDNAAAQIYDHIKEWPYTKVQRIYLDKDSIIDNKIVVDGVTVREPKRDRLIQHLFKIQQMIELYHSKNYNELIRRTSFKITKTADKASLKSTIDALAAMNSATIENVIKFANEYKLCIIDDRLNNFIDNNDYLYWRVKDVSFNVFQKLYKYLEGYVPLSTQHKIKGLEFENVLVVLHNGGWSNYNFEYLLNPNIKNSLTTAKQNSFPKILERTQKLFYVCCTRAKDNLVIYCSSPTLAMIEGAKHLFGTENVFKL